MNYINRDTSNAILNDLTKAWENFFSEATRYKEKAVKIAAANARKKSKEIIQLLKKYRAATIKETKRPV